MNSQEFEDFLRRKNEKLWEDAKKYIEECDEDFDMNDTDSIKLRKKNE